MITSAGSRPLAALLFVLTPALLLALHWRKALPTALRWVGDAALVATVVAAAVAIGRLAAQSIATPPMWDFQAFWSYGRVAVSEGDFYQPAAYYQLFDPARFPPTFVHEIFDVGFLYPPPSIWLFVPLGFADVATAAAIWVPVQLACLAAGILALWSLFLPRSGFPGLAVTAAVALTFRATEYTVVAAQTDFLLLLTLLAFWHARERAAGGAWLAAGIIVKPVLGVLALQPLIRRRWGVLAMSAAIGVAACGATALTFGWPTVRSYFVDNPAGRMRYATFGEWGNQSLLATILRVHPHDADLIAPARDPVYLALSVGILCVTAWCIARLPRDAEHGALALATAIPAALLVYPGTLTHYSILLLVPMLWLWGRRGKRTVTVLGLAGLIALVAGIVRYRSGIHAIIGTALVWLTCVAWSARASRMARMARAARDADSAGAHPQ
jgi:hypothetical protein